MLQPNRQGARPLAVLQMGLHKAGRLNEGEEVPSWDWLVCLWGAAYSRSLSPAEAVHVYFPLSSVYPLLNFDCTKRGTLNRIT